MKRILWLIVAVAAVWGLPRLSHPAVDVGKLEPIETALLTFGEAEVTVETDTGAKGFGPSLAEAMADLRRSAGTEVFLDTTAKLLISGEPGTQWEAIFEMFRPSCLVCRTEEKADLEAATAYLSVHPPKRNLNQIRAGEENLQIFRLEEGRGSLEPE